MTDEHLSVFYALGASLSFASASVFFARFARQISPLWMNTVKALVCGAAILIFLTVTQTWTPLPSRALSGLFASGALGLGIGDLFLLTAFTRIGASRTLLIFGFQPVLMAFAAALLFQQSLHWAQAAALVFFILCLVTLSFERYRKDGHWEMPGLLCAFAGVALDNAGVLLTRSAFDLTPDLHALQANLIRIGGALAVYTIVSLWRPMNLIHQFRKLTLREQSLAIMASLFGTFLSLALYLSALKNGSLAVISGVVLAGPLFSALMECAFQKKWPSLYQMGAFACLVTGMSMVLLLT